MGNPDHLGGFYFVIYQRTGTLSIDRQKGAFRHYIQYLEAGECTYYTDQGCFHLKSGDLFYLPKGLRHTATFKNTRLHSCGLTLFPEAIPTPFAFQLLPRTFISQFLQIPKNITPDTGALAGFYTLLGQLLPCLSHATEPNASALTNKIRTYLWRNYTCHVEDIANHCNLSVPHLYRLLKQETNKTPNQIKQEILIEKAMVRLTQTNASIDFISSELGFSNPNYFGRLFKHYTGKTPSQFRSAAHEDPMEHGFMG